MSRLMAASSPIDTLRVDRGFFVEYFNFPIANSLDGAVILIFQSQGYSRRNDPSISSLGMRVAW